MYVCYCNLSINVLEGKNDSLRSSVARINQSLELDDNELHYPVECSDTDDLLDMMSTSILLFSSVSLIILFY